MINWGLMGAVYAMLHATHGIADYWLQTDWQAQNKSKRWDALWHHALVYSSLFYIPGCFVQIYAGVPGWKVAALPLVIGLPHAWMDRRKFLGWFCAKTKGWKPTDLADMTKNLRQTHDIAMTAAVRTHVTIHMDQKFHYLCLMLTAMWLAWGVP